MNSSQKPLTDYRTWLAQRIHAVLARPTDHAGSLAEAEITLLTLMEAWVGAWSVDHGRSPDRDVVRVVALWRAACRRLRGAGVEHARLATPGVPGSPGGQSSPGDLMRLTDGMARVWEDLRAMCPDAVPVPPRG